MTKKKKVSIKVSDYTYPTIEERKKANKGLTILSNFGFQNINVLGESLDLKRNLNKINYLNNLHQWDYILQHKLFNLHNSYINTITNYNRGLENNSINKIQFNFYTETYFYFLFTTIDNIFQIINAFFELNIKESEISLSKVTSKVKYEPLIEILNGWDKKMNYPEAEPSGYQNNLS